MEKKSLRYAEKTAISLFDEGVTDAAALEERLARIESLSTALGQIRTMFGAASRALSTKEKRMIEQWVLVMKYDMDVLKLAYDATVDAIHEPSFAYANTILDRWYAAGYRTAEDVEAALAEYRRQKEGKSNGFDLDDFFEAALKKTYGEQ
jgi:DnaD/phage-associated family protein